MRVANLMLYNSSQYQLNQTLSKLNEANQAVSTGKRVNTASDDPVAAGRILQIEKSLSYLEQTEQNIDMGKQWLETNETTLNSVLENLLDLKDTALTMANATYNEDDLETAGNSVHQLLLTIVDLANTRVDGKYIFAGTKTDTLPYILDDSVSPSEVIYQGNNSVFAIQLRQNATIEIGYPGESVFGSIASGEDIFSLLVGMEEDLRENGGENLDTIIEGLDTQYNNVVNTISGIGIKAERLEMTETLIADLKLTLMSNQSKLEDADIIESITILTQQQTAYEASLAASSKIMSLSLADYM